MEEVLQLIDKGRIWESIILLRDILHQKRTTLSRDQWTDFVAEELKGQRLWQLIHSCPYTRRAFQKPRGYAGDAVMIDYIYGINTEKLLARLDPAGEEIFRYTTNSVAARAVRYRRRLLARHIDEVCAAEAGMADILAIAAGHLREAELSTQLAAGNVHSFTALDQDSESLLVVEQDYGHYGVKTLHADIKSLISGEIRMDNLSFVYAAGLFDYLVDDAARALAQVMYAMLRPGGRLLVANFVPNHADVGYMESFMEWNLIYRDEQAVRGLFAGTDAATELEISYDPSGCIIFATREK